MAKVFSKKRQTSILFVVDASGSMGVENLMSKTKGLVFSLLKDAYIRRERVGFITFRGTKAELILPFTRSIILAQRELKNIKTGGKTPLSLALRKALEEIKRELLRERDSELILLIFSDGRANISLSGMDPFEEAVLIGKKILEKEVKTFVIDTDPTWINYPYAKDLAKAMKAKYLKLKDVVEGNIRDIIY
ncbi:MAG: VWA domain-containing protein [Proteobacteria bacterium]|nr:VWA domain-containing protein [Pseudomonadota bacterium]